MKVLVVDDSSTMRRIIINGLKSFIKNDLEIIEADDGSVGVQKLEEHGDFTLILTDWNMPVMSGLDFIKKAVEMGVKVPVIMITTEAEKKNVVLAIKAGAKNYVTKPFTPDTLKLKINQTMNTSF